VIGNRRYSGEISATSASSAFRSSPRAPSAARAEEAESAETAFNTEIAEPAEFLTKRHFEEEYVEGPCILA